jgi:membrane protein implicated in regulation of membrane protease activity
MTMFWLFLGIGLCALEAFFPTAFVALVLGVSALILAMLSPWIPMPAQPLLWMGLSALGIWVSRNFVPQNPTPKQWDDAWGEALTEILPGETGRVRYEGASWMACCEMPEESVAAGQTVQVLSRRGTMLVVMPMEGVSPRQPLY